MSHSLEEINQKMKQLEAFISNEELHVAETTVKTALTKFLKFKRIIGNIDMDIHFLASYLANSFLVKSHGISIDLSKTVGSSGFDIESGHVVAEIKTTIPYLDNDFGAKQKETIRKDLERLENSAKKHKYFFVIDKRTEQILKDKYSKCYPSVKIANLLVDG